MSFQTTLIKNKSIEGWLEKKSPTLFVGFQQRYFTIGEDKNNLYLLYDKAPPAKDNKPKGTILLSAIQNIVTKEDSKEFTIQFGERDFILRAPSIAVKKEWILSLNFLKEYQIQQSGSIQSVFSTSKKKQELNVRFFTLI